jgi:hypothetical protein
MEKQRGGAEKELGISLRTRACSGKPKEDRGGLISPATGEEEEDAVVSVVDLGSIPSWHTERMTC